MTIADAAAASTALIQTSNCFSQDDPRENVATDPSHLSTINLTTHAVAACASDDNNNTPLSLTHARTLVSLSLRMCLIGYFSLQSLAGALLSIYSYLYVYKVRRYTDASINAAAAAAEDKYTHLCICMSLSALGSKSYG